MRDELPGDVVENAAVVVDRVADPSGVRIRQVGQASENDDTAPKRAPSLTSGLPSSSMPKAASGWRLNRRPVSRFAVLAWRFARFNLSRALSRLSVTR